MRRSILFTVLIGLLAVSVYAQERASDKIWSRIKPDAVRAAQSSNPDYVYVPSAVGFQRWQFKGTDAIVSPNFRPFPTTNTTQSELSIDMHPSNNNIVFMGANTTPAPATTVYGTGCYWTTNGGTNWGGFDNPPFGTNSGDPANVVGVNGNFYVGFIDGGTNDGGQGIAFSTDNGGTWTRKVAAPKPTSTADLLDKNHLMIDKKASSPFVNRLYVAYTEFITGSPNNNQIVVRYSSDGGNTFSSGSNLSSALAAGSHNQGVNVQTGPNGEVYAAWAVYDQWAAGSYGEDAMGFAKSTDGGATWGAPKKLYTAANFGIRGNLTNKGSIRVASFPSMAVDRSGGSFNGYIYVTWPQKGVAPAGTDPDIVVARSSDNGTTWSAPVRVNNDALNNGKDQYFSWATVDQATGHLYVVFYDNRNTTTDSSGVYIARSIDGGVTFENLQVSDRNFKPKTVSGLASGYQGDYIGIAAYANVVYPYWMEDRTGNYQAWTAKVSFGPNILHAALGNTENIAGPYKVSAKIVSQLPLNASRVKVYWGRGESGAITDSITMTSVTADSFVANIPGNNAAALYSYYIYAEDNTGGYSTYPAGAPANKVQFRAAPDNVPPVIRHTDITDQFRETWPVVVNASATDNIGVDTMKVVYKLKSSGTLRTVTLGRLNDTSFSGPFVLDTALIALGDTLYYRIVAVDRGVARNNGFYPSSTGWVTFKFVPDQIMPVASHTPLRNTPKLRWPALVRVAASDNLGIRSVRVDYSIRNGAITNNFLCNLASPGFYEGRFNVDTAQIRVGDTVKYKVTVVDGSNSRNTVTLPATGTYNFAIINTLGVILVVNDDVSLAARVSPEKQGVADLMSPLGASSTLIATTLSNVGYTVDTTNWAALDTNSLTSYDIVALVAGVKASVDMFADAAKRRAMVRFTLNGGKTFVEGGEVGYRYRKSGTTTDLDPEFRRHILNDSSWVSDVSTALLKKRILQHPIFNTPNFIPDSLAFSATNPTYAAKDAMNIMPGKPGVFKISGYVPTYPDTAGIIAYSPTNDPANIRNLFYPFSVGNLINTTAAAGLIENGFAFLMNGGGFVPVELSSFTAAAVGNEVTLNWGTATEKNNSGFMVQRSAKGAKSFNDLGFVAGRGTTVEPGQYIFTDRGVQSGSYTYRLRQVDFDGTVSYSPEVNVEVGVPEVFSLEQNYPNPFNPSTTIAYNLPKDAMVNLALYNVLGQKVMDIVAENQKAGKYEVVFDASQLTSGIYFYKLEAGTFTATRKMTLLK